MSSDSLSKPDIAEARLVLSSNRDERPAGCEISLLVIHNISLPPGEFGGDWIEDLFLNRLDPQAHPYFKSICELKVSAHLLIRRSGELIQFVPLEQRAWHAGESMFAGVERCNDYSIGIELEGCDEEGFEEAQYQMLGRVTRQLMQRFPAITLDRIVGHSDISPGRKTDPGPAFDWEHYRSLIGKA